MTYDEIVLEIDNLSTDERLSLIATIAETLKKERVKKHSLLELDGLGAELWQGIEATDYVKSLRSERNPRSDVGGFEFVSVEAGGEGAE